MIYLDNAATSFPKPDKVYEEVLRCMKEYCANPGRGGHYMSIESGKAVMEAREAICSFFNIRNPMQLSFTKNATEALNVAIKGLLKAGDHVITTTMEHNSVVRPLKTLEKELGIELTFIQGNEYGEVDIADIQRAVKENTRLIAATASSNVNGIIMPFRKIGEIAKAKGIVFLLDAAQGAGAITIDVEEDHIDMMAFPGHKSLLGPQGTGALYVRENVILKELMQGGTGSNSENVFQPEIMPDMLESGTLNTPGIVGMGAGVGFINSFGLENIKLYKAMLVKKLHDGITEIGGMKLYSKNDINHNSGIVAMNVDGIDSTEISYVLDKVYGIATRAGLHCAPMAHAALGTMKTGVVRFSIGCFNTVQEIDLVLNALKEIVLKTQNN
ncbi:MAG: aminotransferase class V-fold PLP-dependent enzyme [Clostridia bacterium]|nr:aminotransferase class V-fold PLP-dependent enzyme [Clostridia bacterium]